MPTRPRLTRKSLALAAGLPPPGPPKPAAAEPAQPARIRIFTLNSQEAHEALCTPPDPMLIRGSLPPEPMRRDPQVIVEPGAGRGRRR